MRISAIGLAFLLTLGLTSLGHPAEAPAPLIFDVWPGQAPGEDGSIGAEKAETKPGQTAIIHLTNVTKPTISLFRADRERNTGAAVLVFPGGGYNVLAWDHEGEQVARWLNSIGVTAVVLKYRVPRRKDTPKDASPPQPLYDAQRALSLVRSKASEWGIDAKRIGVLGFSAGGHLAASASTRYDQRSYEPIDAIDRVDCRPDFAVLIYPGGLVKKGTDQLAAGFHVTSQTPPMFLAHAGDDGVSPENSALLYLALKRAGVPAELHIYSSGGHGFGMRPSQHPIAAWPQRCEEWMREQGVLKAGSKP